MDQTFERDIGAGILSVLECPVCYESMHTQILQCTSGHSLCCQCAKKVDKCPVCQVPLKDMVRNYGLEKLADQLQVACPNSAEGCSQKVWPQDLPEHEGRCQYGPYTCPLSIDTLVGCSWVGRRADLKKHAMDTHPLHTFNIKDTYLRSFYDFHLEYVNDVSILLRGEDTFVSINHYDKAEGKCYKIVQYIGPSADACRFKYNISYGDETGLRDLRFRRRVHGEGEDIQTLMMSEDCFAISETQIKLYLLPDHQHLSNIWTIEDVQ